VRRVARRLSEAGVRVQGIEHSGLIRAQETAEILAEALGGSVAAAPGLGPSDEVASVAGRFGERTEESLMLVGHLPFMERLAAYLLSGDAEAEMLHFRTGAVACLSDDGGHWVLEWFLMPDLA
jgi:phosphohistidine phosphatase